MRCAPDCPCCNSAASAPTLYWPEPFPLPRINLCNTSNVWPFRTPISVSGAKCLLARTLGIPEASTADGATSWLSRLLPCAFQLPFPFPLPVPLPLPWPPPRGERGNGGEAPAVGETEEDERTLSIDERGGSPVGRLDTTDVGDEVSCDPCPGDEPKPIPVPEDGWNECAPILLLCCLARWGTRSVEGCCTGKGMRRGTLEAGCVCVAFAAEAGGAEDRVVEAYGEVAVGVSDPLERVGLAASLFLVGSGMGMGMCDPLPWSFMPDEPELAVDVNVLAVGLLTGSFTCRPTSCMCCRSVCACLSL